MAADEYDQQTSNAGEVPAGRPLADAEAGIRRCLRAVGAIPEGERYGAEWRALESWCAEEGLIANAACVPERKGGREHDLRQISESGVWLKFTMPWASGYAVDLSGQEPILLPARPLQYLERMRMQNRYFGDAIRFVGISADAKQRRMIIMQPDITGRPPTWAELDEWFHGQGYRKLGVRKLGAYDSVAYAGHGVGVFDVRPANVVVSDDQRLFPIDLILRKLTPNQTKRLLVEQKP